MENRGLSAEKRLTPKAITRVAGYKSNGCLQEQGFGEIFHLRK